MQLPPNRLEVGIWSRANECRYRCARVENYVATRHNIEVTAHNDLLFDSFHTY